MGLNAWKNVFFSLFILVIMLSITVPLKAAETAAVTELALFGEDMVSGVTKRTEKTYEAAANVTVLPGKFLERYAIRNINDLFEVIEGGWHTYKGQDEVLVLRGVSGYANDKVLFLYDGMLFPTFLGLGENNWPNSFDDVERVEIVKGPNTSVWGGQGTQGTINIVHKGAQQFQGLSTSLVVGKGAMARYNINYAQKPTDDLSYQFLVNSTYYYGLTKHVEEWGGWSDRILDGHTAANPLPDYQVFANMNYKDFTIAYRRLESRTDRHNISAANAITRVENFADDVNVLIKKPEFWKNTDWTTTVRFNNFYQMYDVFSPESKGGGYEMKTEKRYEVDSNVTMKPIDPLNVVLGAQAGVWSPQGSGASANWDPTTRPWSPNIPGSGNIYDPPEFLPTFTEMGNDIAALEGYVDAKYQLLDNLSLTGGGRYVGEFNPGDQFRDPREKLHQFFPKAAVVFSPLENLFLKGIYQQGFTRLNTFERYSEQNNIALRGTQKATTAESTEFVVDYRPIKNMKVLASYYQENMYDWVNFVYTGVAWPALDASLGQLRGFFNVGDIQTKGLEANVSYDWKNMGGFISGSQLLKDRIANYNPALYGGSGGITGENDSNFNKAAVPRWNMSIGGYVDITDNYSVSGIYKIAEKIMSRGEQWDDPAVGWDSGYIWEGGSQLDLVATAKNVIIKNLNLSIMGKNVQNTQFFTGSSMDPEHAEQMNPVYYEVKASYLW
jgi:outer membrane receptor protein involved in Fe transport